MNWLNPFTDGSAAARACLRSSWASATLMFAPWIVYPYCRALAKASCSVSTNGPLGSVPPGCGRPCPACTVGPPGTGLAAGGFCIFGAPVFDAGGFAPPGAPCEPGSFCCPGAPGVPPGLGGACAETTAAKASARIAERVMRWRRAVISTATAFVPQYTANAEVSLKAVFQGLFRPLQYDGHGAASCRSW